MAYFTGFFKLSWESGGVHAHETKTDYSDPHHCCNSWTLFVLCLSTDSMNLMVSGRFRWFLGHSSTSFFHVWDGCFCVGRTEKLRLSGVLCEVGAALAAQTAFSRANSLTSGRMAACTP
jgi:hypothetical protein